MAEANYSPNLGVILSETPGAVKVYRALLTQSGTAAPVATVLENSLGGTVVWTRADVGEYVATLAGAFPAAKTWCPLFGQTVNTTGISGVFSRLSDNALSFLGSDDDVLASFAVEILVYP